MSSHHKGVPGQGVASRPSTGSAAPRPAGVSLGAARSASTWSRDQWGAALPAALAQLGMSLDAAQQGQLAAYMAMLSHWNSTYNLTALRDPQDMLTHHLMDCLTVLTPLARQLAERRGVSTTSPTPSPLRLLDVGSGGGLPGVVLAICCPGIQVTCVDTVGKKAAFIRQVAAELRLPNLRAEHARVEQLKTRYDLITSRAFASLVDFVSLTRMLLADQGMWMAMKGKQPDEELAALPADISVFHVEQLSVPGLDAQRCLVWMRPN